MDAFRTGSGSSQLDDAALAGRHAAEQAVRALDGAEPALVITYAAMCYDHAQLLAGIRSVTGDAPLVGATSSGHFADGELTPPGRGVRVLALTAGPYRFGVASRTGLRDQAYQTGQELARAALADFGAEQRRYGALIVLSDSFSGDLQGMLNGIYRVAGAAVPVVGGSAGADRDVSRPTYVFHNGEVFSNGAVAVWVGSDRPIRIVHGHGWQAHGLPMLVTRADGPTVYEIDGRPAAEVYREKFRTPDTPPDAGEEWWRGFHPRQAFGLVEPDGAEIIRAAYIGPDDVPRTFTPLPPYGAVRVMTADPDNLLDVCESVVNDALAERNATVLLVFSCTARMEILGERAGEEAALLQKIAGPVRTFGFCTYGEFARSSGVSGYHNATLAAVAL